MRVIAGEKRGKNLVTLEGEKVRPTTDRVKESLFNILQFSIAGKRFLDMYAGSGQMAIEALSRGAEHATLIDNSRESFGVCQKNLEATSYLDKAKLVNAESITYVRNQSELFDIAFLDPPYHQNLLDESLCVVAEKMNKTGTIICEHPANMPLPEVVGDFSRVKKYRYGKIELSLYIVA
ncbi:MAG: 16S rRNA (guanine(966)-N(2))-methyltransferase RsmD [Clostridia bacterium]